MDEMCDLDQKKNVINQDFYSKYNVKRGSRSVDGTCVHVLGRRNW